MAIEWHLIEQLPFDRKDGRDVLLWDDRGGVVASWSNGGWDTGHASEITGEMIMVETATHWADINRPGDNLELPQSQEDFVEAMAKKHNIRLRKSTF